MGRGSEAVKVGLATLLTIVTLVAVPFVVYAGAGLLPDASPAEWTDPVVSDDGRSVTVSFTGGTCDDPSADVEETSTQVTVSVRNVDDWFIRGCDDIGIPKQITVELDAPLGERELVDGNA